MTTALISHPDCLAHVTPPGHPERVDRLRAVEAALGTEPFAHLLRVEAPLATDEQLVRVHPQRHLDALAARRPAEGWASLDPDTHLGPQSLAAARRAAGANVLAVDMVLGGEVSNAFCAVRPPGHHAERVRAMGFCFFSSAAVGAMHALAAHGLSRVAVLDFDVHHGNGTQDAVERDPRVMFVSSHEWPLYPGTGAESETGVGNVANLCLPGGADGPAFRRAWEGRGLPAVDAFAPELIVISAGFDAHARDPLASLRLSTDDFAWITHAICDLADRHCAGRVVSTLEGGYDLEALARSCAAHVAVLAERAR